MTEAQQAEIRDRHQRGQSTKQIAVALGIGKTTVWRNLSYHNANLERERAQAWKSRNRQHLSAYNHDYQQRNRRVCLHCNELCSYRARICRSCRHAQARARCALIENLWRAGRPLNEIAIELGSTRRALAKIVFAMRRAGWPLDFRYDIESGLTPKDWGPSIRTDIARLRAMREEVGRPTPGEPA